MALYGSVNSLAQTVLKIAAPGIPDFYQGSELWDLALVDPDNRRPVDYVRRQTLLEDMRARIEARPDELGSVCDELCDSWRDGRVKMYVTLRALTLRRQLATLFRSGGYEALSTEGEHAAHIVALARWDDTNSVVVVVPRLTARLTAFGGRYPLGDSVWGDTRIVLDRPGFEGRYTDRFSGLHIATGRRNGTPTLPVGALLARFPLAMLRREATP